MHISSQKENITSTESIAGSGLGKSSEDPSKEFFRLCEIKYKEQDHSNLLAEKKCGSTYDGRK
jgi:hypothetical protein